MITIPNTKDVALYGQNRDAIRNPELSTTLLTVYGWLEWTLGPGGYIGNHAERTVGLLIEQFRVDKPRINTLVSSVAKFCQEIEDVLYDLLRFRCIALASGEQLDRIGEIVGCVRASADDEIYRSDIYFQIFLNLSSGEPETLLSALKRVTEAQHIDYCEPCPATVLLTLNQVIRPLPSDIKVKMKSLAAAGVAVDLQYNNSANIFIFNGDIMSSSNTPPYYTTSDPAFIGMGFSELYGDGHTEGGGSFSEIIT
jgi:hypothetical protein